MSDKKYVCQNCNIEFSIQDGCLKKREDNSVLLCVKCYKLKHKYLRLRKYYSKELCDLIMDNNGICEYSIISPYFGIMKNSKKKVRFICAKCNTECAMRICDMSKRKICGFQKICTKCSLKYAVNSDEWRDSNSKAQYIAQNRPEVIEKQRNAQYELMKNDPLYAEKRCSKSYISGIIRGFRFDSSWELYYIVKCWESEDIDSIQRYDGSIPYFDTSGKKRLYFPDFVVNYKNGISRIVEIKGSKKYNNFHEKFNAAKVKHGISYIVYEERDLIDMGIHFRRDSFLKQFYQKYYNEITFFNNKKVTQFREKIEKWLK